MTCHKCSRRRRFHVYVGEPGAGQAYGGGWPLCRTHYETEIGTLMTRMLTHPGFTVRVVACDTKGRCGRTYFSARPRVAESN